MLYGDVEGAEVVELVELVDVQVAIVISLAFWWPLESIEVHLSFIGLELMFQLVPCRGGSTFPD